MINYSRHRKAIERLYTDRCTINRMGNVEDPTSKKTRKQLAAVYVDQPCRLSQSKLPSNGQTEAQNDIRYESKLFMAPEMEIKQGDTLTVQRGTDTGSNWSPYGPALTYQAGEPYPYPTHQEISLQREDYA